MKGILLLLEESMGTRRPNDRKLSGLSNVLLELCKSVPFETVFKNDVECMSGMHTYNIHLMEAPHAVLKARLENQ